MFAINNSTGKKSSKNTFIIVGVIALESDLLFVYLMFYVSPELTFELVKVIAVIPEGVLLRHLTAIQ